MKTYTLREEKCAKPLSSEKYEIAGLGFGHGMLPKICVPLTAGDVPGLESQLAATEALPADLYEFRIDFFEGDVEAALKLLAEKSARPLLATVRTKDQGGQAALSPEEYEGRVEALLRAGGFQLVDIELCCGEDRVKRLVEAAHRQGVGAVVSQHDFLRTPPKADMTATLLRMSALGADLPKLAVMPQTAWDVLALMGATLEASEQVGPVITMSMGELGKASRACGGLIGSCLTFGAGEEASAPGQIPVGKLRDILGALTPGGAQG